MSELVKYWLPQTNAIELGIIQESPYCVYWPDEGSDIYDSIMMGLIGDPEGLRIMIGENFNTREQVALKIPKLRKDMYRSEEANESYMQTKLDHPNVLKSYGLVRIETPVGYKTLIVQELADCVVPDLEHEGQLGLSEIDVIMRDILSAVAYTHEEGIIHRDIKPSNIFKVGGVYKLGDYEYSIESNGFYEDDLVAGSFPFIAPECIFKGEVTHLNDIHSLGVTLYTLLTGNFNPWGRRNDARFNYNNGGPLIYTDGIPNDLLNVVLKSTAFDPGNRYQTAAEMARDLGLNLH